MISFLIDLTAYNFSLPFFIAKKTFPKVPLPTTLKNLKSPSLAAPASGRESNLSFFDFDANIGDTFSYFLDCLLGVLN